VIYTCQSKYATPHSGGIVETVLGAILEMIGFYVIILTGAMVLIVVVVQVFKALSARREAKTPAMPSPVPSTLLGEEASDELAAMTAAISLVVFGGKPLGVSEWSRVERGAYSLWKLASRSRRIPSGGG
jgi:hypothetical protein